MSIQDTRLFIKKPAHELIDNYDPENAPTEFRSHDDAVFVYSNGDGEFGLSIDLGSAQGAQWTHLFHSKPNDPSAIARVLSNLKVSPQDIHPGTDWHGNPLVDVQPILLALQHYQNVQTEARRDEPKRSSSKSSTPTKHMKTFSQKPADVVKKWVLIDAEGLVVGRLASIVANRLRGKHKPSFTPHVDDGDNVVIVNADKVAYTGKRFTDKVYYWQTGQPGGVKKRTAGHILEGRIPEQIIEKAVERMLPRGPLGRRQLKNLRIYSGSEIPEIIIDEFLNPERTNRRLSGKK